MDLIFNISEDMLLGANTLRGFIFPVEVRWGDAKLLHVPKPPLESAVHHQYFELCGGGTSHATMVCFGTYNRWLNNLFPPTIIFNSGFYIRVPTTAVDLLQKPHHCRIGSQMNSDACGTC